MDKIVIYSLLPRLWGNDTKELQPNGTLKQNGSGTLAQLDTAALSYIRSLGCTHLWCIGLLEHATTTEFEGIAPDPEEMVKGRAGSPYALRDYYDIAPSLAVNTSERFREFEALVVRVHQSGLKLLIDFIPNHVARSYASDACPVGVVDLGADDDVSKHFDPQNNFYYFPGEELHLPQAGSWHEYPAKATGNDSFTANPSATDWYETVKLNYGVDYLGGGRHHFDPVPKTWYRMLEILDFWASKGVDGFRCDMAEMVPEAFWAWAIPQLRARHTQELCFLAEIYQPQRYASYIAAGFDYLYDKVGVYDTLRAIMRGEASASSFDGARDAVGELQERMCYFLENHDEQRIASDFFAGNAEVGIPALASLLFAGANPYLHYFGQEVGEAGMQAEGFSGLDGRTTIFDYWALDKVQRLRGSYFGAWLTLSEESLLHSYRELIRLSKNESCFTEGAYYGLNFAQGDGYDTHRCLSYVRYTEAAAVLFVANFAPEVRSLRIQLPDYVLRTIGIVPNEPLRREELLGAESSSIDTLTHLAPYSIDLGPYGIRVIRFSRLR